MPLYDNVLFFNIRMEIFDISGLAINYVGELSVNKFLVGQISQIADMKTDIRKKGII